MTSKTLGVTIGAGGTFERMALAAAARFNALTGAPVRILSSADWAAAKVSKPHHLKFELFRLFPDAEEIVFFDADVIFLEAFDLEALRAPVGFSAVRDLVEMPWIVHDAARAGVPVGNYFNSGLFWIARERAELLPLARDLRRNLEIVSPFNDQTFLNAAAARTGGLHYLDARFNTHVDPVHTETLEGIVGAHFHFVAKDPDRLARYYAEPKSLFWRREV